MTKERSRPGTADPTLAFMAEIEARIAKLDLVSELAAAGMPYSELDENGQIVTHYPAPKAT